MTNKQFVKDLASKKPLKGLKHCHARGLHSIILQDKPLIRIFITTPDHELWKVDHLGIPSTIAFHPHHCDLGLESVKNYFKNVSFDARHDSRKHTFGVYQWDSVINGGRGRFKDLHYNVTNGICEEFVASESPDFINYNPNNAIFMTSKEIHTVWVPQGMISAWLVYEHKEDPNYIPVSYSLNNLLNFNSEGMYVPMEHKEARELIELAVS